jgi:N-formylglutamate amidohydrolase
VGQTRAQSASFEDAPFGNREAMAARSRGRNPRETRQEQDLSREAAAAMGRAEFAAAASRLATFFVSFSAGLRPQLVRLQVCFVRKVKVLFKETRSGL